MEITKREIIASITIIAVWICFGMLIGGKIDEWQQDKNAEYDRAARITERELFEHGMETNLGNAFVYGELKAKDPISYPELKEKYSYIRKVKERYTMHTRAVTKTRTNANGKTETYQETETYWTWDEIHRESQKAKDFTFLGNSFSEKKINLPGADYIETIKESSDIRCKYYGIPEVMKGTIYTELSEGTIKDDSQFYDGKTIEEVTEELESGAGAVAFWVIWMIALICFVYGFYKMDNRWLNRG